MALVFAVMHSYNIFFTFYCFCPFLFYTFFESGSSIDKLMKRSMIQVCHSLMFFFNRAIPRGLNSSKILSLMFVHVFCKSVTGLILRILENLWFNDLCAELQSK